MIRKLPLHARVVCTDGQAGESTSIVIHPATRSVTHLVVQDQTFPIPKELLVPIEKVKETSSGAIQLSCTRAELEDMQPFSREHFIEQEFTDYGYAYSLPYMLTPMEMEPMPIEELNIPPEDMALDRGTSVEAQDGFVGRVGELLLDPQSNRISHIVLMRGHLWGKKEIVIPLSLVERSEPDTIYLKADKKYIDGLPSIPINRPWKEVGAADLDLMVWSFNGVSQADEALKKLKELEEALPGGFVNVIQVIKGLDGKVSYRQEKEVRTRGGVISGAVTGGLLGMLIGPGGAIVGAALGAAAGQQAAKNVDIGVSKDRIQAFQDNMPLGTAAIGLVLEHRWYEAARKSLAGFDTELFHQRLTSIGIDSPDADSGVSPT